MIKILFDLSTELGMDVIFEIHNSAELDRAMIFAPKLISVNVRSIDTNEAAPFLSNNLIKQIPSHVIRIAESDMAEPENVTFFINEGFDALLISDSLMQSNDIADHLKKLLGK
jgi:indole-3-glycerol phosphate synthase